MTVNPIAQQRASAPAVGSSADARAALAAGLDVAYQPIVHLGSGSVIAYEALARPRYAGTPNPLAFFAALEGAGLRQEGEQLALRTAVAGARGLRGAKLFVNASPGTLLHPDFHAEDVAQVLREHGLAAGHLVIEVTESEEIGDLAALAVKAQQLRRVGIQLAVDDAGAGHASFRVITRLRPAYIKIDRDLVSSMDRDGARHAFIESLVRFSRQIGSRLVAEGIETPEELSSLTGLGVEAGQGYFLARPEIGDFVNPSRQSRRLIAATAQRLRLGGPAVTAAELARPVRTVDRDLPVSALAEQFTRHASVGLLLVIGPDGRPLGQITRRTFERLLSVPGAWELLGSRPAGDLADTQAPTVQAGFDVADLAATLAARGAGEESDDVLVCDAVGTPTGTVSVGDVMRALAAQHRRMDGYLHPVTGLAGAAWIEQELAARCAEPEPCSVVLVDLDGFRLVNAAAGFAVGDELLRDTGRCLARVANAAGGAAAHLGGDDFLLLLPTPACEDTVAEVVRRFENEVAPTVRVELLRRDAGAILDCFGLSIAALEVVEPPTAGTRLVPWVSTRLAGAMGVARDQVGYAYARTSTLGSVGLTVWRDNPEAQRSVSLGRAEPALVLAALDALDGAWEAWWQREDALVDDTRFPGPRGAAEGQMQRHLHPIRTAAEAAGPDSGVLVDLRLEGSQAELLELLDRMALVTAPLLRSRGGRADHALLARMISQRARVIVREDFAEVATPGAVFRAGAGEG